MTVAWADMPRAMVRVAALDRIVERLRALDLGVVERHFLLCPFCGNRASLDDHRCSGCGSLAENVVWSSSSPELVMVARTDNSGIGNRWL